MRLLCSLNDPKKAQSISYFLKSKHIDNFCELKANTDWGSSDYGNMTTTIWVIEEDKFDEAARLLTEFEQNPEHNLSPAPFSSQTSMLLPPKNAPLRHIRIEKPKTSLDRKPLGVLTFYLIALCCILLLVSELTSPPLVTPPPGIPYAPLYSAPVKKELLFDYPYAFELIDHIVRAYGIERLQDPASLPLPGQMLLQEFYRTPYWRGFYDLLLFHIQQPDQPWTLDAPLFEKIREGQFWRLFTPCLLHSDIFHLFFNMIWLAVIGRQMEERLGKGYYLLFIVITGIFSNVLQYLMGGPNFIGFSGVLCAMLTYIWVRQKRAAWEGYQLLPSTMGFISIFILAMLGLQLISFTLEAFGYNPISPGIANTAHLSGAAIGWFIGYMKR